MAAGACAATGVEWEAVPFPLTVSDPHTGGPWSRSQGRPESQHREPQGHSEDTIRPASLGEGWASNCFLPRMVRGVANSGLSGLSYARHHTVSAPLERALGGEKEKAELKPGDQEASGLTGTSGRLAV